MARESRDAVEARGASGVRVRPAPQNNYNVGGIPEYVIDVIDRRTPRDRAGAARAGPRRPVPPPARRDTGRARGQPPAHPPAASSHPRRTGHAGRARGAAAPADGQIARADRIRQPTLRATPSVRSTH